MAKNPNNQNNEENKNNQTPENNQNDQGKNEDSIIINKDGKVIDAKQKKGLKKWVKIALAIGGLLLIAGGVVYIVYKGKHVPVAAIEKAAEVAVPVAEALGAVA